MSQMSTRRSRWRRRYQRSTGSCCTMGLQTHSRPASPATNRDRSRAERRSAPLANPDTTALTASTQEPPPSWIALTAPPTSRTLSFLAGPARGEQGESQPGPASRSCRFAWWPGARARSLQTDPAAGFEPRGARGAQPDGSTSTTPPALPGRSSVLPRRWAARAPPRGSGTSGRAGGRRPGPGPLDRTRASATDPARRPHPVRLIAAPSLPPLLVGSEDQLRHQPHVTCHGRSGALSITSGDGLGHLHVRQGTGHGVGLARGAALPQGAQQHEGALDELDQARVPGGPGQGQVEGLVEAAKGLNVPSPSRSEGLLGQAPYLPAGSLRRPAGHGPGCHRFQALPHLVGIPDGLPGGAHDPAPPGRVGLDEANVAQLEQRLPHRGLAHVELAGQAGPRRAGPRGQLLAHDGEPNGLVDPLGERVGPVPRSQQGPQGTRHGPVRGGLPTVIPSPPSRNRSSRHARAAWGRLAKLDPLNGLDYHRALLGD